MAGRRPNSTVSRTSTADRPPRTPRWVWLFGSVVSVFVLAVSTYVIAGGDHGGGAHGAGAVDTVTDPGAQLPAGLQVATSGYTLSPIKVPGSTGSAGTLSFSILGPGGEPVTEFTESKTKDLHLIVVRADTAEYRHVHPTVDANGTWSVAWEWKSAGTYKVFADFIPTKLGSGLTLARTIEVAGNYAPRPRSEPTTVSKVDEYTVTLSGNLGAGKNSLITAAVERNGQPVTDLEPYLGANGHLVVLRDGDLAYVHAHADGGEPGNGKLAFNFQAPTAGTYRLFLDFQMAGQVRTADFTVETAEPAGAGPDAPSAEHQPGRGGH